MLRVARFSVFTSYWVTFLQATLKKLLYLKQISRIKSNRFPNMETWIWQTMGKCKCGQCVYHVQNHFCCEIYWDILRERKEDG